MPTLTAVAVTPVPSALKAATTSPMCELSAVIVVVSPPRVSVNDGWRSVYCAGSV